jgi:glycosyltransferase involved in cell wall biosynthesis
MKILALCDSPTMTTGFARVAQNLFRRWAAAGVVIDCWGVGFGGWFYKNHPYVNEFFPGGRGGQWYQPANLTLFLGQLQRGGYTHVWIMQDTFLLSPNGFPKALRKECKKRNIQSVLYFPVDAALDPLWTEIVAAAQTPVAYTEFGRSEALAQLEKSEFYSAGKAIEVIGHGVDATLYQPFPAETRSELRTRLWNERWLKPDDFLMINVNMNQRRKDVARSLEVLAELRRRQVPAKLLMHMPESSADGLSLEAVGGQLGLRVDKDWGHHGALFRGAQSKISEGKLVEFYNVADCYLTTTLGEGWGLGITEALACGLPVALPMHTACREIADRLMELGMGERVIPLAVEAHALYLETDNSRQRYRTDVRDAADKLEVYYRSDRWRERPALNPAVREWLSWDRIAGRFLELMGNKAGERPTSNVQTSARMEVEVLS